MFDDVARALALVLVIEGILPFLKPAIWRMTFMRLIKYSDEWLRIAGFLSMLSGIGLLYWMR